jgi:hypothetical protein
VNWREFFADIIGSAAWPVAVIVIVFLLRVPLSALLGGLRAVRYKEWKLDFGQEVDEVEALAEEAHLPPADVDGEEEVVIDPLAVASPRGAVIEAWVVVERELRALGERHAVDVKRRPPNGILRELRRQEVLPERGAEIVRGLYRIRTSAVHSDSFSPPPDDVARFVEVSERAAELLRATP